jgi:hypothetical protein
LAFADKSGALVIYEVATGHSRLTMAREKNHGKDYKAWMSFAYSPDSRLLAAPSVDGNTIEIWDLATAQRVHRIDSVQGDLSAVTFVKNGELLATGGSDTAVLLWDLTEVRRKLRLPRSALAADDFARLWQQLGSNDPQQAIWKLVQGEDATVKYFREQIRPVPAPPSNEVEQWIRQLHAENFATRQQANEMLEKCGESIEPKLREFLARNPPLEGKRRIAFLLANIAKVQATPLTQLGMREMRALEIAEHIGSATAREFLSELSQSAGDARLGREARASLRRLQTRSSQ